MQYNVISTQFERLNFSQYIHELLGRTHYCLLQWPKHAHQSVPMKVLLSVSDSHILQTLCNLFQHPQLFLPLGSQVFQHDSTITAEAITKIQTRKNSINHWVLYSPFIVLNERTRLVGDFSGNLTLMLATIRHFNIVTRK